MANPIDTAEEVLGGIVFVIEMITFSLFFFEESYVNMIRVYKEPLYYRKVSELMVHDYTNWDHILGYGLIFLKNYGKIAVYSYKSFVTFFFMCALWRSYGGYVRTGKRFEFDFNEFADGKVMSFDHDDWDQYLNKIWDGRIG